MGAGGDEEGAVSLPAKLLEGDIPADLDSGAELHAETADEVDVLIQLLAGQSISRDTQRQHAHRAWSSVRRRLAGSRGPPDRERRRDQPVRFRLMATFSGWISIGTGGGVEPLCRFIANPGRTA